LNHIAIVLGAAEKVFLKLPNFDIVANRDQKWLAAMPNEFNSRDFFLLYRIANVQEQLTKAFKRHASFVAEFVIFVTIPAAQIAIFRYFDYKLDVRSI
jgi:hypothetical protein